MICRWCNTDQKALEYAVPPVCPRCSAMTTPALRQGDCAFWINPDGSLWLDHGRDRYTIVGIKSASTPNGRKP